MATPGADRSTVAAPKLEKSARLSSRSLAATQMTFGASSTHGATGLKSVLTASLPELATKRVDGCRPDGVELDLGDAEAAEARVHDPRPVTRRVRVRGGRVGARQRAVEAGHPQRQNPNAGGHARHARAVPAARRDDARHERAVAEPDRRIGGIAVAVEEVVAARGDVGGQIGMVGADPAVDHRHRHIGAPCRDVPGLGGIDVHVGRRGAEAAHELARGVKAPLLAQEGVVRDPVQAAHEVRLRPDHVGTATQPSQRRANGHAGVQGQDANARQRQPPLHVAAHSLRRCPAGGHARPAIEPDDDLPRLVASRARAPRRAV